LSRIARSPAAPSTRPNISYLLIQQITSSLTGKPCFAVWDKSGTYYQFGCTGDSLQSWYDGSTQHDYRWDLDKIIAPNENAGYFNIIQVSYLQDCVNTSGQSASCSSTTTVRDAALEQISYGYSTPGTLLHTVRTYYAYTLKVTNPSGSATCTVGAPAGPGSGPTPNGNSDCVGDNCFAPGESDWIDYYHSEYRGFAAVATDDGGNLFRVAGAISPSTATRVPRAGRPRPAISAI
jgi:hypothetical protein